MQRAKSTVDPWHGAGGQWPVQCHPVCVFKYMLLQSPQEKMFPVRTRIHITRNQLTLLHQDQIFIDTLHEFSRRPGGERGRWKSRLWRVQVGLFYDMLRCVKFAQARFGCLLLRLVGWPPQEDISKCRKHSYDLHLSPYHDYFAACI